MRRGGAGLLAALLVALWAAAAWAQQVMEFRPISGDSVASIRVSPGEVRVTTKSGRVVTMKDRPGGSATAQAPEPPETPESPEPPEPPDVSINRSHDVVRFGGSIHVRPDEVVTGNVVALGGDVTVEGQVQGDVVCLGGTVTLEGSARVDGDVVSMGGEIQRRPGAQVGGQTVTAPRVPGALFSVPFIGIMGFVGKAVQAATALFMMLIFMGLAWVLASWLPDRTQGAVDALRARPAHALGFGLAMWMLIIPSIIALALVVVILCITIIGIPLALVALLGYGLGVVGLLLWGYVVGCAAFGGQVSGRLGRPSRTLVQAALWGVGCIGVLIAAGKLLSGLGMLGLVGGALVWVTSIIAVGALTMGAGALLVTRLGSGAPARWWPQWRTGKESAPAGAAPAVPLPGAPEPGPPPAAPPTG